ncbi:preprotein translocase subunit YajC [Thermaurantiacus sp.]
MLHSPAFAQAAGGGPAGTTAILIQVAPLILLFAIFWFLIIRPQQKRLKDHRDMVAAVKRGDDVVTGGGLIGKVTKVTDTDVEVELAPNVRVKAVKSTLSSVTPRGAPPAANDGKA